VSDLAPFSETYSLAQELDAAKIARRTYLPALGLFVKLIMTDLLPKPDNKIAVVVPSFRVKSHIIEVLNGIGPGVWRIFVIDDCCPDGSGDFVRQHCRDPRVEVLRNKQNLGVGGAVLAGYRAAVAAGADIIVKIDGDGQMDPALLSHFVAPIISGEADYAKGNRFYNLENVRSMPAVRLAGNAVLSFMTKFSSGYWNIFDPTNGYTAIHANIVRILPLEKIKKRYFFESDMLFRLNTVRAKVVDIPMLARYADEKSNLSVHKVITEFFWHNIANGCKRIFYSYFLRDFSVATLELVFGLLLLTGGVIFGAVEWVIHARQNTFASTGTVMLSALPVLSGLQLLLAFINYDVATVPSNAIHGQLIAENQPRKEGEL
jgi:glycosyltransferase involved in cell wall biosynthesis